MSAPLRITLIGFSGTGKSAVAQLIADKLGWDAVDTDELIVQTAGKSIPDLFTDEGEAAFRRREAATVADLVELDRSVVAIGGGATLMDQTRRDVAEAGIIVCLEATPETIAQRLSHLDGEDERPLLAGADAEAIARIRKLKAQRASLYTLADLTLHTDALTLDQVATEVADWYRAHADQAFDRPGRVDSLSVAPPGLPAVVDAPKAAAIVRTPSGDYPAYVNWNGLEALGDETLRATNARRVFLISDEKVLSLWGETAISSLREAGIETTSISIPAGDASKSLDEATRIYEWLAENRCERRDVVVGLGGGMVTDFAGFVAATYLRGLPVVHAPTSLLGMVDASIGGKTAVNLAGAKNIVGAFYQPRAVVADVATLQTLPRRELIEGMGEVVKHAFIRDPDLLTLLEDRLDDVLNLEPTLITDVVARNIRIKASVVSEDERETGGVRELLNYGHTLGHAFEAAGNYSALLHGEAISAGMMAAAEIGLRSGITPQHVVDRQRELLLRCGLPLRPPGGLDPERVRSALSLDKKIVAGGLRWVLLEDVGRPVVRSDIRREIVEEVMDEYLS